MAGLGARTLSGTAALVVMAKAPRPGAVKTRLVPPLTPQQAAALARAMLRDVADTAARAAGWAGAVPVLGHAPGDVPSDFAGLAPPGFLFHAQRGADLGARMAGMVDDLLQAGMSAVCLIGADLPELRAAALRDALRRLARPGDRVVLAPAADGGYGLIGLKRPHPALFADMRWSVPSVFAETLARAATLRLPVVRLPSVADVDDPADLARLGRLVASGAQAAPATAAWLAAHGSLVSTV